MTLQATDVQVLKEREAWIGTDQEGSPFPSNTNTFFYEGDNDGDSLAP